MKNNSAKFIMMITLISGILISISSNSWLGVWIGLEINLLSFIPIMSSSEDTLTSEASMKYFIVQAMASAMLIFIVTITGLTMTPNTTLTEFILNIPLLTKMGSAPFHWWFPSVMEGLQWNNCFILLTIQKVTPLILISYTMKFNMLSTMIISSSLIVGSVGGYNQTSLRKILTYSSINHLGWMMAATIISNLMLIMYLSIYSTMNWIITKVLKTMNSSHINQIMSPSQTSITKKILIMMTLMSLGGLPPLVGFLPKWLMILSMTNDKNFIIATLMITTSLMTLYYYMRLAYSTFMINDTKMKWINNHQVNSNFYTPAMNIIIIVGMSSLLPLTYALY